jgi:hypothetical protein
MKTRHSFLFERQVCLAFALASVILPGSTLADSLVAAWGRNGSYATYGPNWLSNVRAVAATYGNNLAVSSNGVVVAWAQTSAFLQNGYYPGFSNAVAVVGGASIYVALNSDSTASAIGLGGPPPGLSNVTMVAAGWSHFLALKRDGTIVAWGSNTFGQTNVPPGLSNVTAIAAGDFHSLALKQDGTLIAWGSNASGQTNVPAGLPAITAIGAGAAHNLAVDSSGRVIAWGNNSGGQATVPSNLSNVTAVAGGGSHSLALKSDGTVVAWGDNAGGQTNVPLGLSHAVAISARGDGSLALLSGNIPPLISVEPMSGIVAPGVFTNFLCLAQGSVPLAYQWRQNGTNIADNLTVMAFNPAQTSDSGAYTVLVSNRFGTQESKPGIWVISSATNLTLSLRPVGSVSLPGLKLLFQVEICDSSGNCYLPPQSSSLQLQASTNLFDWVVIPNGLLITNGFLLVRDPDGAGLSRRFYRILQR